MVPFMHVDLEKIKKRYGKKRLGVALIFIANFVDQDGDGVDDRFQSGPGEAKAPPYSPPKQPINILPSTGLPAIANYASMAPQFTGSEYTNQGVSPAFLENLRRFYG